MQLYILQYSQDKEVTLLKKKGAFTSLNLQYAMTHTAGISLAMIGNTFITHLKNK